MKPLTDRQTGGVIQIYVICNSSVTKLKQKGTCILEIPMNKDTYNIIKKNDDTCIL